MTRLGIALLVVVAFGSCQPGNGVVPDWEMELHVSNGTPLDLVLAVNGQVEPLAPNAQGDFSASRLPSLPWFAEVSTTTGRILLSLTVRSGDVIETSNSRKGDLARVDLSCGRIDLWSGPPAGGPAPGPGARANAFLDRESVHTIE